VHYFQHLAARTKQWSVIRILVGAGANTEQKNFAGETAKHIVSERFQFPSIDPFLAMIYL
jgi:hypothetical protein